ncbi:MULTISPECIES: SGNH/GDSL hydrolase family protein [Sphingomonas]|jgi:hypothetical protein|nr:MULTISPECIES: SGNH/GDSL hydrolase family protein [Sphingomonas]
MTARQSGAQGGMTDRALDMKLATRNLRMPANNRVAVFGPSHAAQHFAGTNASGEVPTLLGQTVGAVHWANFLSGGRALLEPADMVARNGEWTGPMAWNGIDYPGLMSRVERLLATGVGHVVMVAPSANDRNAWTAAQSIANLTAIVDRIVEAGMLLTILLDYPHGAAAYTVMRLSNTAASPQLDHWNVVNRWLLTLHGQRGIRVVDTPAILGDLTSAEGQAASGVTIDGLHLSTQGAYLVGRVLAREWRRLYPLGNVLPFGQAERPGQAGVNPGAIVSTQPYFGGTGGTPGSGATGQIGTGWTTALAAGVSGTYSKATTTGFGGRNYIDEDGPPTKDWQQIALSGTASGTADVILLRQAINPAIGDPLRAVAEIEVDPGTTGLSGIGIYIFHSGSGQQIRAFGTPPSGLADPWPSQGLAGVMRTPRWVADSNLCYLQLSAKPINGGAVSATLRVRGMAVGKTL